jgi:hypothetical protein
MSAKIFVLTVAFIATFGLAQSAIQKCFVKDEVPKDKSDTDGNALLEATDCEDGITMCMNMTVMDSEKMRTGTKFACAEAGKTEGCTITDGKKTCYCTGATCNKYTQANFYDPIKCNVKDEVPKDTSDVDGNALLVATDCDEGITMCMNMTVMDSEKMRTGTKFACAEAGKTEGCTITDGKKTCYCEGAECNKYTQAYFYSSAVTISTPALLISALIVSGFASTS